MELIRKDAERLGFTFEEIGKYEKCPAGTYKVAFVIDPNYPDYHWYRQDSNGFWSHKQGTTEVLNVDGNNLPIIDPETANRENEEYNLHYTIFVGFYYVTPLE